MGSYLLSNLLNTKEIWDHGGLGRSAQLRGQWQRAGGMVFGRSLEQECTHMKIPANLTGFKYPPSIGYDTFITPHWQRMVLVVTYNQHVLTSNFLSVPVVWIPRGVSGCGRSWSPWLRHPCTVMQGKAAKWWFPGRAGDKVKAEVPVDEVSVVRR